MAVPWFDLDFMIKSPRATASRDASGTAGRDAGVTRETVSSEGGAVAFDGTIWRRGHRFMEIVDFLHNADWIVNALPRTVARYAALLARCGVMRNE